MQIRFVLLLSFLLFCTSLHADDPREKDSLLQKGIDLYKQGEYEQSIVILEARLKTALDQNDKNTLKVIYNNLGNDYSNIGKTVEALKAYENTISIAEELKDKKSVAKATKNIGALYADIQDFEKALKKYDEAEKIALSINDTFTLADCANNKGVVFEQQKKYKEAIENYTKALELYRELKKDERIAILYNNLGIVYKYLKDYDSSIIFYQRSLDISEKIDSKFMVAANLINIGNVYEMKGDYKKAIELNEKGLQTGKEINSQELIMEVYENLASDYAKSGDYKTGYDMYKTYTAVKDSFINIERSKQLAEIQTKYETEKKETQIIKLEKTRYQMTAVIGIMVLLIVVAYLLYNRQQALQKQAREKAIQDAEFNERMRIAKDVHDDLGSGLSKISLTANVAEQKALNNGNTASDIRHIASMSKDLVDNMRDLIWVLNPENTTLDNLVARMREYCADYLDGMGVEANLSFPDHVPDMHISREMQRNIFSTVKEAINNCVKHAGAASISIVLTLNENTFDLAIIDDGKGIDMKSLKGSGNGLRNMKQRIGSIGGDFSIDTGLTTGTKIQIVVPLSKLRSVV